MSEITFARAPPPAGFGRSQTKRRATSSIARRCVHRHAPELAASTATPAPVVCLAASVLVTATALRLRASATILAVRLATTTVGFRPRRALRMWRSLLTRSLLTRSHLRPRGRLPATTATIELTSRGLRRSTRPLSRRHVVHLIGARLRRTWGSTATIRLRRTVAATHIYVRLLHVPTTSAPSDLRAAGSRRAVIVAASKGVRLATAARGAARFTTAASARWAVVAARYVSGRLTARRCATVEVRATRPVVASCGAAVGVCASNAATRPIVATASGVATACNAARSIVVTGRKIADSCSTSGPVIVDCRRAVTLCAASSGRPIIATRRVRWLTTGATVVLRTAAATSTTTHLGAARSSRRPIVMAGYMLRPTVPRPATVSVHVRAASRGTVIITRTALRPVSRHAVLTATVPFTSPGSLDTMAGKQARPLSRSNARFALVN